MTLATLSPAALIDLVRSTAAHPDRWRQHVQFTDNERYFHLLRSDEMVGMWLLTWLPGQATTLHDHGGSAAAIAVAQGELHEVQADRDGGLQHHSLTTASAHWLGPDAVHDIYNSGRPPAISIHAYSPPLRSMTFYERVSGSLVAVKTVPTTEPEA